MEAATPRGIARAEDPGPNEVREALKPCPGKRPLQWKSATFCTFEASPFFFTKTTQPLALT